MTSSFNFLMIILLLCQHLWFAKHWIKSQRDYPCCCWAHTFKDIWKADYPIIGSPHAFFYSPLKKLHFSEKPKKLARSKVYKLGGFGTSVREYAGTIGDSFFPPSLPTGSRTALYSSGVTCTLYPFITSDPHYPGKNGFLLCFALQSPKGCKPHNKWAKSASTDPVTSLFPLSPQNPDNIHFSTSTTKFLFVYCSNTEAPSSSRVCKRRGWMTQGVCVLWCVLESWSTCWGSWSRDKNPRWCVFGGEVGGRVMDRGSNPRPIVCSFLPQNEDFLGPGGSKRLP